MSLFSKLIVIMVMLFSSTVVFALNLKSCNDTGVASDEVRVINYIKGPNSGDGVVRIYYNGPWDEFGSHGTSRTFITAPLEVHKESFFITGTPFTKYLLPQSCLVTVPGGSTLVLQGDTTIPDKSKWNVRCTVLN